MRPCLLDVLRAGLRAHLIRPPGSINLAGREAIRRAYALVVDADDKSNIDFLKEFDHLSVPGSLFESGVMVVDWDCPFVNSRDDDPATAKMGIVGALLQFDQELEAVHAWPVRVTPDFHVFPPRQFPPDLRWLTLLLTSEGRLSSVEYGCQKDRDRFKEPVKDRARSGPVDISDDGSDEYGYMTATSLKSIILATMACDAHAPTYTHDPSAEDRRWWASACPASFLCSYKVLAIGGPREEVEGGERSEDAGDSVRRRKHHVRGHRFWSWNGERYVWRKPHWRGDQNLGIIVKDYKLRTPTQGDTHA